VAISIRKRNMHMANRPFCVFQLRLDISVTGPLTKRNTLVMSGPSMLVQCRFLLG
jgi:hypothetical protein